MSDFMNYVYNGCEMHQSQNKVKSLLMKGEYENILVDNTGDLFSSHYSICRDSEPDLA